MQNKLVTQSPVKSTNDKAPVQNTNVTPNKAFPESKNPNQSAVN
jgi:hypothetical protein